MAVQVLVFSLLPPGQVLILGKWGWKSGSGSGSGCPGFGSNSFQKVGVQVFKDPGFHRGFAKVGVQVSSEVSQKWVSRFRLIRYHIRHGKTYRAGAGGKGDGRPGHSQKPLYCFSNGSGTKPAPATCGAERRSPRLLPGRRCRQCLVYCQSQRPSRAIHTRWITQ